MNILYAVQATGNGHISRAMELLPYLEQYGRVDVFLSGANSNLPLDAPVKYRSKGLSLFYNCRGGLDYWQLIKKIQPARIRSEVNQLPVEKYDLIINDFEYITAAACAKKGIPSVNFGHQASFQSAHTPRPVKKSRTGEWVLKSYAKASRYIGLHFKKYDDFIFTPVIKREILQAPVSDKGHIIVYLPAYCERQLKAVFSEWGDIRFEIFSHQTHSPRTEGNIRFFPIDKQLFNESFAHCHGIITGGGFETPAEALHMGKKMISIPIKGQYEQQCNAAALAAMGVTCLSSLSRGFDTVFERWMQQKDHLQQDYSRSTEQALMYLFSDTEQYNLKHSPATPSNILNALLF
ncbi:MAG TPA: glycosyltransferase family protein [Chitinophagaceae bacterium]|nr:glycosyltransferase family protein [Chitinophagaceae bacterium]